MVMDFQIKEATIRGIHRALMSKRLTVTDLVKEYLNQIESIDNNGAKLNSIIIQYSMLFQSIKNC